MARVVLLTGGNLGPVAENLASACAAIGQRIGPVVLLSSVMTSEPWGFEADERFLNQALVAETALEPEQVLDRCQQIERELGRRRTEGRGYRSRTMDIDMLFYDDLVIDTPRLSVPHPLIAQREFVLAPLDEILPGLLHPLLGKTVRELLAELRAQTENGKAPGSV